jgi:hypothetical protein
MTRIEDGFESGDAVAQVLGNITARTDEAAEMLVVDPPGQRRTLRPVLTLMVVMMLALSVLCAAMFTEPAIPQIEEVGRLVHRT